MKTKQSTTEVFSTEKDTSHSGYARLCDVFPLFYGKDKLRPAIMNPFRQNGKVYATDAYTAICIDEKDCDFEFENEYQEKAPNIEKIFPIPNAERVLNIKISDFEKFMTSDEIEHIGEDIECSTCNGEGEVEWEFERWTKDFECPACYGTGHESRSKERKTGNKTFGEYRVKIGESYFNMRKFFVLIRVQKAIGGKIELIHIPEKPTGVHLFKVGICQIIIMPAPLYNLDDCEGVLNVA